MRQCQGCGCENGIDDFIAIQICEECASKLEESASSASHNTAQPAIQLPNAGAFILLATEVGIEAHLASKLRRAIVQQAGA